MVANGWERQNLLADRAFRPRDGHVDGGRTGQSALDSQRRPLSASQHLRSSRTNAQETAIRINTVEQFVTLSVAPCEYPPVLESRRSADGYSASYYDVVARKFQAAMPDPKLAPADTSGGAGGTGSK